MFKNYITIAFRTFWKNKVFSVINILGLSIGISASLVIYLLVNYHFTFDKFEKDNNRIYRVVSNFSSSGETYHNSGVPDPMAGAVQKELTGLDMAVPFRTWDSDVKVSVPAEGNKEAVIFKHQNSIVFADSNYFRLLNYNWLAGSLKTSLNEPYQTVLTEPIAKLYFPKLTASQIVGKQILFNDTVTATVTGVVKDLKENTSFTFKTFVAYTTLENTSLHPENWGRWDNTNGAQQLFVKLSAGATTTNIEKQIAQLYKKYNKPDPNDHSIGWQTLQPLKDVHFNAEYGAYNLPLASRPVLYGLLAVAVFLLLLGCINFINLTTAQASQRAKEIGIRKTMGSSKRQLVFQFLSETFLLTLIATFLSIVFTPLIFKAFSDFIPETLHFNTTEQPNIIIFLVLLIITVTVLSGCYPAFILSGYKPVLVLKNQAYADTGKTRNAWLRKSLTISQFVIAQVFIMSTVVVSKQITYSLNKDMGFKKDAVLFITTNFYDTVSNHKFQLINKLKAIPEIAMISLCTNPPSSHNTWSGPMKYTDGKKEIETDVQQKYGDTNYIKLYQIKLLAGKNFEQTDTLTSFLINENYAHILGFQQPQQAVGKYLQLGKSKIPIAGVVADFNLRSLHEPIKPVAIASRTNIERNISIALQPQNNAGTTWKIAIRKIEKAWKEVYPQDDFEYTFLDEEISKYYDEEKHISGLLIWATGLAVFISCLGLLGLVIYTTAQRTKEIGVRKVLGASITQVVSLISKDFIMLVILAFLIATPLAWIAMHKWLQNFAYRTNISWWIFLLSGCIMLFVALFTLAFQTIKAAVANPVKSLRTE